tara:strand:+ start:579 stop:1691 length:1113 start_codon:yes stop_codon:yes gene_type:complete
MIRKRLAEDLRHALGSVASYNLRRQLGMGSKKRQPQVCYGMLQVPPPESRTFGGMVKVQRLQTMYPNEIASANILYLVSSCLPRGAVAIARDAIRAGCRLVLNQNGVAYPGWYGSGWEHVNAPMRSLMSMAHHIFYQSEFCRTGADRFLGDPTCPTEVLYNCVDMGKFQPLKERGNTGELTLLLGGTQYQKYRLMIALETLAMVRAELPGARLVVTGSLSWQADTGDALAQAQHRCMELDIEDAVTFHGPYLQAEAADLYRTADILLHTKYNDPCPGLVVEAMACGLPVVYSDSGGVPELVGPEAGIGVPAPLDWEEDHLPHPRNLADAVCKVAVNVDRYAEAARQRAVDLFDINPWFQRHREVFEMILA